MTDLASLRTKDEKQKPLIFVAHSLGGLIVKDLLSLSIQKDSKIVQATIGIAFLGTPHRGSRVASLGKIAFELSRLLFQNPNIKALRVLERNSEILERISSSFEHVLTSNPLHVHSFREELETNGVLVVDASSSTLNCQNEARSSIHADHRNMVRFSSASDVNFQRVSAVLRRWVDRCYFETQASSQSINLNGRIRSAEALLDEEYERCLNTLDISETRYRLLNVDSAYSATYEWLYDDGIGFKSWLEGESPSTIFWISGKPGSGKSTLMKYAMTRASTMKYLESFGSLPWLLTGYFFHDRGGEMQKSITGFLHGIIYQILRQQPGLFGLIQSIYRQKSMAFVPWTDLRLRQALFTIFSSPESSLSCCLFVDALDEEDGNHRDLISILMELAHIPERPNFRLRLCLAGRPENIFKDAFAMAPGFAIQDHTLKDIRHYAEDRLQKSSSEILDEEGSRAASRLVDTVEKKAEGVFLWVKLVVDELVEGLCEGDTLEELEALLSDIPTELSELYTRAIRRIRRTSTAALMRTRHETYIMFQIALSAINPIPFEYFLRAATFLSSGWSAVKDIERMTETQRERRLNSRSAGLLERYGAEYEKGPYNRTASCVQFIHQSVKEFANTEIGQRIIEEKVERHIREDGTVLIFQYLSEDLLDTDPNGYGWTMENLSLYGLKLESQGIPVGHWFEGSPMSLCVGRLTEILGVSDAGSPEVFVELTVELDRNHTDVGIFYLLSGFHMSVKSYLQRYGNELNSKESMALFEAAAHRYAQDADNWSCIEILAEARILVRIAPEHAKELRRRFRILLKGSQQTQIARFRRLWNELALQGGFDGESLGFIESSEDSLKQS